MDANRTADRIFDAVEQYIDKRLKALTDRIAELEQRPEVKYRGVWSDNQDYDEGSLATHGGSLWYANQMTTARPGTSKHWTMCAKRGSFDERRAQ